MPAVLDVVGYGTSNTFERPGPGHRGLDGSSARAAAAGTDTDDNAADFTAGAGTPQNRTCGRRPTEPPADPAAHSIEEIQGTARPARSPGRR